MNNIRNEIANIESKLKRYNIEEETSSPIPTDRYIYIGIPIGVLVILSLWKPPFVQKKDNNPLSEDEELIEDQKSVDLKKLLLWSILIGGSLDIAFYSYKIRKGRT